MVSMENCIRKPQNPKTVSVGLATPISKVLSIEFVIVIGVLLISSNGSQRGRGHHRVAPRRERGREAIRNFTRFCEDTERMVDVHCLQ